MVSSVSHSFRDSKTRFYRKAARNAKNLEGGRQPRIMAGNHSVSGARHNRGVSPVAGLTVAARVEAAAMDGDPRTMCFRGRTSGRDRGGHMDWSGMDWNGVGAGLRPAPTRDPPLRVAPLTGCRGGRMTYPIYYATGAENRGNSLKSPSMSCTPALRIGERLRENDSQEHPIAAIIQESGIHQAPAFPVLGEGIRGQRPRMVAQAGSQRRGFDTWNLS